MVQAIASSLGATTPYLPTSVVMSLGAQAEVRIARGWPSAPQLDADLKAGIANVTVFPITGTARHTLRYLFHWRQNAAVAPTLTASASGATATFGGTGGAGQVAGIAVGDGNPRAAYAYRLSSSDTPGTVAGALAAMIPNATSAGPSVTLATNQAVQAVVAADQPAWLETRRQVQGIWVMVWCPTPQMRDVISAIVDAGFANLQDAYGRQSEFLALPDGSAAWVKYGGLAVDDKGQQAGVYRRNMRYMVDYATTLLQSQPEVLFAGGHIDQTELDETVEYGAMQPGT